MIMCKNILLIIMDKMYAQTDKMLPQIDKMLPQIDKMLPQTDKMLPCDKFKIYMFQKVCISNFCSKF